MADGRTLIEKVVAAESGAREPRGATRWLVVNLAVLWSLFQLWISSPVPFWVAEAAPALQPYVMFNDTMARSIHLAFAVFLTYLCYPLHGTAARQRVPAYDWLLALAAAFCAAYPFVYHAALSTRPGSPVTQDVVVACLGVLMLLEATRRALGRPMVIMAVLFLVYVFAGRYMPDMIAHKGASLARAASHFWTTTEGVFGVALGVSTSFVFLYVLFGAMLDQAGAGNYLTRLALALMGHMRGGPAKAAVLSSGLNGIISGSSVANVLTGGNVTIMLMKRVGYTPVKAGAIEVASSSNGQIMPPVMGAAAFLMVEYVNVPYSEVIKHAFLPALLAYLSLMYIVHLEALKSGMKGLPKRPAPLARKLAGWGVTISGTLVIVYACTLLTRWLPGAFGEHATWAAAAIVLAAYLATLWYAATRFPTAEPWAEIAPEHLTELPETRPTFLAGVFYIVPVFVLVWCLMALDQSPGLAAFYACAVMGVMLVTQHWLMGLFKGAGRTGTLARGWRDLYVSLEKGARNMIGIALATAVAGIIVGTVSLTGIGQVLANVVEELSFGSLMGVLILTALFSLVLGMGLPTTANYIVTATLLAPVIVALAASHGLEVPLIAVHLFVFYFGIMADATPPVALAAYAAAGLSGADPLETGIQGFIYEMRTAVLPFVFLFNTELLMINVGGPLNFAWVCATALIACFAFASATQSYLLVPNRRWETALLLLVAFSLFRPDIYRDWFYPQFELKPATEIPNVVASLPEGAVMRLRIEVEAGIKGEGEKEVRTFLLPVTQGPEGRRLERAGLLVAPGERGLEIQDVIVDSPAEKVRLSAENRNRILGIEVRLPQPHKGWFTLPAWLALLVVFFSQRRRAGGGKTQARLR